VMIDEVDKVSRAGVTCADRNEYCTGSCLPWLFLSIEPVLVGSRS